MNIYKMGDPIEEEYIKGNVIRLLDQLEIRASMDRESWEEIEGELFYVLRNVFLMGKMMNMVEDKND